MIWSPQQERALEQVRLWLDFPGEKKIFRLFGFAGTGKTTLAIQIASMVRGRCLFASFTGKAALVMRRKGCDGARTIHSLIYEVREGEDDDDSPIFQLNPDSELCKAALLIVDECSMVDEELGLDVMSFEVPVLVLGDPAQLPPVAGAGYFTNHEPDVMLTEIHRQAEGNPIIHIATDIRLGKRVAFGNYRGDLAPGAGVSVIRRTQLMRGSMMAADQIICGKNDTRCTINRKMRSHLREAGKLAPPADEASGDRPIVGDRVICLKNKRDRALFNGGIWNVKEILKGWPSKKDGEIKKAGRRDVSYLRLDSVDDERTDVPVRVPHAFWLWDGKAEHLKLAADIKRRTHDEFDFAYAITCHKSQGSQWNKVVVIDERFIFGRYDADDPDEMPRRWAYTAVTRAAEALILAI
jgi:exodeoxyribonuclease-5